MTSSSYSVTTKHYYIKNTSNREKLVNLCQLFRNSIKMLVKSPHSRKPYRRQILVRSVITLRTIAVLPILLYESRFLNRHAETSGKHTPPQTACRKEHVATRIAQARPKQGNKIKRNTKIEQRNRKTKLASTKQTSEAQEEEPTNDAANHIEMKTDESNKIAPARLNTKRSDCRKPNR